MPIPLKPSETPCGVCDKPLGHVPEVPGQLCFRCASQVADENGRRLSFWSNVQKGGHRVTYMDTGEQHDGNVCFVKGIRCKAVDSEFGGVCFQVEPEPPAD